MPKSGVKLFTQITFQNVKITKSFVERCSITPDRTKSKIV